MQEDIKVIIVDDEPEARELLITLLADYPNIIVTAQSGSVDEALGYITANPPDIVFLDIHMPKKNGFDLTNSMRNLKIKSHIIFITAYDQYAIKAIKNAAFDYLLKPINEEELRDTIIRFQSSTNKVDIVEKMDVLYKAINGSARLRFTTRSGFTFINMHEIVYLEAEGNYTSIYLLNGKEETITQSLGQIEEELSANNFFRINRSVIINLKYIARVNKRNKTCHISAGKTEIEFYIPVEQIKLLEAIDY
jgi:two-component system, LytTR family, response regulator